MVVLVSNGQRTLPNFIGFICGPNQRERYYYVSTNGGFHIFGNLATFDA